MSDNKDAPSSSKSEFDKTCKKSIPDCKNNSPRQNTGDVNPVKSRLTLNTFTSLASNIRRASSHLSISTDFSSKKSDKCDNSKETPSNSFMTSGVFSPKKRPKWIAKFNCAKLKCIKNSICNDTMRQIKSRSRNCLCNCSHKGLEEENSSAATASRDSSSRLINIGLQTGSSSHTENVLPATAAETTSKSDGSAGTSSNNEPEPLYGSVPTTSASEYSASTSLSARESNAENAAEAASNKNDKWVQIFYPSENGEDEEEDESDDFVRHSAAHTLQQGSIMITQHICGRTANGHGEKRCFQLICPTEVNVDAIRNLLQSHFAVDAVSKCHTQVDYIHYLVPDLRQITSCSFYWGKMDRYEAERLLEGKPEGTFLLRDSAQDEFLFSVSFRKYGRSLHARIEQFNHKFSFDSHDPGVYASDTVCGLIEHYKDPSCCMFFEPILTLPLHRNFTFSLQHLCRSVITSKLQYDTIDLLQLPNVLKMYLKEYHYRQKVCVKRFDLGEVQCVDL